MVNMIIDVHAHILDEKTFQEYESKSKGQVSKIITMPKQSSPEVSKALEFTAGQEKFATLGRVIFKNDLKSQLEAHEELFKQGKIVGIKLTPGYEHFTMNGDFAREVAKLCLKYDKPLVFHTGDPASYVPTAKLKYVNPLDIDDLAVDMPDLKIVVSHFGLPWHVETAMMVYKNKNVFTDISGTLVSIKSNPKNEKELYNQYVADLKRALAYYPSVAKKTMFGTDYVGCGTELELLEPYINLVNDVFDEADREDVFYKTAQKVYGL